MTDDDLMQTYNVMKASVEFACAAIMERQQKFDSRRA